MSNQRIPYHCPKCGGNGYYEYELHADKHNDGYLIDNVYTCGSCGTQWVEKEYSRSYGYEIYDDNGELAEAAYTQEDIN